MKDLVKRFEFYIRSSTRIKDDIDKSICDIEEGENGRHMDGPFKYLVEELISLHQKEPNKLYDILLIMHEKGRHKALQQISNELHGLEYYEDEEV